MYERYILAGGSGTRLISSNKGNVKANGTNI